MLSTRQNIVLLDLAYTMSTRILLTRIEHVFTILKRSRISTIVLFFQNFILGHKIKLGWASDFVSVWMLDSFAVW